MVHLLVAFTLQVSGASSPLIARFDPARSSVGALRDSLEAAELRFFSEWTDAFKLTQGYAPEIYGVRGILANCISFSGRTDGKVDAAEWVGRIKSSKSAFAVCPSWTVDDSLAYDEREGIDFALDQRFRAPIRAARESLIGVFAVAARALPADPWISGQLVRLLVDQRDAGRALDAARGCRAHPSWCGSLAAFVLAERGEVSAADSAFAVAIAVMNSDARCRWTDVGVLLDDAGRSAYDGLSCAQRDSVNEVLWWLSDPLWTVSANERRVAHYARRVGVALRAAVRRDERWDWREVQGGDALQGMVIRYGWPSYTYWWGNMPDRAQTGRYLVSYQRGAANPPYTTFEYAPGRLQPIPVWDAIIKPASASTSHWMLSSPRVRPLNAPSDSVPWRTRADEEDLYKMVRQWWWPQSHFTPQAPIEQLPDGETAFLRRQSGGIVAMVMDPDSVLLSRPRSSMLHRTLVVTARPDSFTFVAQAPSEAAKPIVLFAPIDARPAVVGVEVRDTIGGTEWFARTRFGIKPPAALSTMKPGELAISDLLLLGAPVAGSELPVAAEDALAQIRSSALPPNTSAFGLYWETYGLAPSDTVEIAVWIERFTPQGIFRQFGIALNVAKDLNTPVVMSWTEYGKAARVHVIPGPIPVVGRNVVVDIGALIPGDYWLGVVVRKPGQEPVRSRRTLTVRAR